MGNFEDFCSSEVSNQRLFPRRCWGRYSQFGADLPVSASEIKHHERLECSALPSSLLRHCLRLLFNLEIAFEKELELLHAEVICETCKVKARIGFQRRKKGTGTLQASLNNCYSFGERFCIIVRSPAGESNNLVADVKGFGVFDDPKDELGQGFEQPQIPRHPPADLNLVLV